MLVRKKALTLKSDHKGFRRNLGKYGKNNLYLVLVVTQLYSAAKASNYTTVLNCKFFNMLNAKSISFAVLTYIHQRPLSGLYAVHT